MCTLQHQWHHAFHNLFLSKACCISAVSRMQWIKSILILREILLIQLHLAHPTPSFISRLWRKKSQRSLVPIVHVSAVHLTSGRQRHVHDIDPSCCQFWLHLLQIHVVLIVSGAGCARYGIFRKTCQRVPQLSNDRVRLKSRPLLLFPLLFHLSPAACHSVAHSFFSHLAICAKNLAKGLRNQITKPA